MFHPQKKWYLFPNLRRIRIYNFHPGCMKRRHVVRMKVPAIDGFNTVRKTANSYVTLNSYFPFFSCWQVKSMHKMAVFSRWVINRLSELSEQNLPLMRSPTVATIHNRIITGTRIVVHSISAASTITIWRSFVGVYLPQNLGHRSTFFVSLLTLNDLKKRPPTLQISSRETPGYTRSSPHL